MENQAEIILKAIQFNELNKIDEMGFIRTVDTEKLIIWVNPNA